MASRKPSKPSGRSPVAAKRKFAIQLQPQAAPVRVFPPGFDEVIANDYAYQYLETLGVNPTRENMTFLLKEMPVKNCHVSATWRSRGWLTDSLNITPGGRVGPGRRVEGQHGRAGKAGFAVA